MINQRTLCLLKCRAAKKFKTNLFNVGLTFKLSNSNFSFEESGTSSDLCLEVTTKLSDCLSVLGGELARDDDVDGKMNLMICPLDCSHELKAQSQSVPIPIKLESSVIGYLEAARSDIESDKLVCL